MAVPVVIPEPPPINQVHVGWDKRANFMVGLRKRRSSRMNAYSRVKCDRTRRPTGTSRFLVPPYLGMRFSV